MNDFTRLLPEEVVLNIFRKLTPKDLCLASQVNSEWKRYCNDKEIWKNLVFSHPELSFIIKKRDITVNEDMHQEIDRKNLHLINEQWNHWKDFFRERTLIDRRWKIGTKTKEYILKGHTQTVFCVKIMGDDKVISAGADGYIRIWDIESEKPALVTMAHSNGMLGLSYDDSTNRVASGSFDGNFNVSKINLNKSQILSTMSVRELKELLRKKGVDFSGCIEKADLINKIEATGALSVFQSISEVTNAHNGVIIGMDLKGDLLATGSRDTSIKIWDVPSGKLLKTVKGHTDGVNVVEFFDQKRKLCSSANDASIKFWDIEKGICLNTFREHVAWVWGLTFNESSGVAVSCSVDSTIRIWDYTKANCIHVINNPSKKEFAGVSVDWNAHRLIGTSFDGFVRLWDTRNYKLLGSFGGHRERLTRCDLNENILASASFDGDVRVVSFL